MGSPNGNSLPPRSTPPPPPLFTSSLNFICATLAGMRTLKKKKKKLHPAAAPEEPCGIWPPPSGGKSALSNTNMAKSPRHSRGNATTPTFPRPRFPNIPAVTCGPLPGAGAGARGWDRGACEIENNKSPQWKCSCWTIGTNRLASRERTPPRWSQPRLAGALGPALPTLQNSSYLTAEHTPLLQSLSLPFLRSETRRGKRMRMYICREHIVLDFPFDHHRERWRIRGQVQS